MSPDKTIQPEYFTKFQCITTRCEDTCCSGWQICVDHGFYERCITCPDPALRASLTQAVKPLGKGATAGGYALMKLAGNACPFLTQDKLCGIQRSAGEAFISDLCHTFPRVYNRVDGALERSASPSCPEAARLILLSPGPIRFVENGPDAGARTDGAPELNTADPAYTAKPYALFHEIRRFAIELLQNLAYPLEDRLILLGRFCLELDGGAEPEGLMAAYAQNMESHRFDDLLGSVPDAPAAQLKTLGTLLEFRLKTGAVGPRFADCFDRFRQGLRYSYAAAQSDLSWVWRTAHNEFYRPFMQAHPLLLENWLVNYVFSTLFPLGPQKCENPKSIYTQPRGIFAAYMLLVIHFAFVKNLLVGLAAYHEKDFNESHVVELVQAFSKDIGHDAPYLKHVLGFFEEHGLMNLAYAAMIIRN